MATETVNKNKQKRKIDISEIANKLLLSAGELGCLLGFSQSKIFNMLAAGQLPPSVRIGHQRKWSRAVVEKWIRLYCPNMEIFLALTENENNT